MILNETRAKEFLERYNLSAIVSSGRENTTYLTDFLAVHYIRDRMASGPSSAPGSGNNYLQTYGMYTRSGKRVLILPQARYLFTDPKFSPNLEVYTYGVMMSLREQPPRFDTRQEREFAALQQRSDRNFKSPAEALSTAVKQFGEGGDLGLDYSDIHSASLQMLNESKAAKKVKNATEMFRILRMVKSDEETQRIKKAVEITEIALEKAIESLKEGVTETELKRVFATSLTSNGGLFENAFMSPMGTRSGGMAAPNDERKLARGDFGWFDLGCSYLAYHSDTGESFCFGKSEERQARIYKALDEVVERSIKITSPGTKTSDLCDEVVQIWDKHGIPRPPTGMGHGIGLETHEYPLIASQGGIFLPGESRIKDEVVEVSPNFEVEEGMVLNFEVPYMVWGWGGVHIEKTVVVDKNGCHLIAPQERHLRVIS